jgi:hypothetical protein
MDDAAGVEAVAVSGQQRPRTHCGLMLTPGLVPLMQHTVGGLQYAVHSEKHPKWNS